MPPAAEQRRPGVVPVALAAFCAVVNVWCFSQADWNGVWASWLALFLVEELWAAWAKTGGTLSERWWAWLGIRPRRPWRQARIGAVGVFVLELGAHLVTGGVFWWSGGLAIGGTAVPVVIVVAYALLREREESVGLGKLKDEAVWWLALRWLKRKVSDKEGTLAKVLEALKGWKLVIAVLALFVVNVWDAMHNGHAGNLVGSILSVIGWLPAGDWTGEAMGRAVIGAVAIIGMAGKLITAYKQQRAGAKMGELLSTNGYVKAAIADQGVKKTLTDAGVPAVAQKG